MRTIAVVNQKGGCGKTITSINLAAFLARAGRRVLLVDLDPQGHSTLGLSPGALPPTRTMYDVFPGDTRSSPLPLLDIVRPVSEHFDLAPADVLLSAVPEALAGVTGRENVLAWAFLELPGRYDYVLVDCPPNVGLLTFNALKACNEALIPMDPSFFSLHGIAKLFETFEVLERETGHRITARVLVTLYAGRTTFAKSVLEEVRQHLDGRHYATVVRQSVKLAEAASHGVPVCRYAIRSAGFEDYQALAGEVLRQETTEAAHRVATAPVVTEEGVLFTIEAPGAGLVQLAGDFNGWTPEGAELEAVGQLWQKRLPLVPGRYRYRYVIDGVWHRDPHNAAVEPSPFGGEDSVLVLEQPPAAAGFPSGSGADGTA